MEDFNMNTKNKIYSSIDTWAKTKTKPSLQPFDFAIQHHSFDPTITPTLPTPRNSTYDAQELQQAIEASLWDMWAMVFEDTQLSRNHPVKVYQHHKL